MGNCNRPSSHKRVIPSHLPEASGKHHSELTYPAIAALNVTSIASNRHSAYVEFPLPPPAISESKDVSLIDMRLWTSECILPGLDPVGGTQIPCQDASFCTTDGVSLFLGVMDGHGPEGRDVVAYCKKKALSAYAAGKAGYQHAPRKFLEDLVKTLDNEVKSQSTEFDSDNSGWYCFLSTLTFILILNASVYIACLGDLKALIATPEIGGKATSEPRPHPMGYQEYIDGMRRDRGVRLEAQVYPVRITGDKKIEDMTEVVRIVRAGGRVHRHPDANKTAPGPLRIWRGDLNHPGLPVSRGIGYRDSADLGVISEAEITQYEVRRGLDRFLVVGSSGLWEIMEDSEVVRFIEKYRDSCQKIAETWQSSEQVTALNVSVAHLLCEEARFRWLPVLEHESVALEDITAIVVELSDEIETEES